MVLAWHGSVNDYVEASGDGSLLSALSGHLCSRCQRVTQGHGRYFRGVCPALREVAVLRRYCPGCRVTYSFLPSFVMPRRRVLLSVLLPQLLDYVVESRSFDRAIEDGAVDRDRFRRAVVWLRNRVEQLEAACSKQLARWFPSFDPWSQSKLRDPPEMPGRRPSTRRLRTVLLLASMLRQLMPGVYPASMIGGPLAVLMCLRHS